MRWWVAIFCVAATGIGCDEAFNSQQAAGEFLAHSERATHQRAKITYTAQASENVEFVLSLYQSGTPGYFRIDLADESENASFFAQGEDDVWCSADPKVVVGESGRTTGVCSRDSDLAAGAALLLQPLAPALFDPSELGDPEIVAKRRQRVQGQDTECYTERFDLTDVSREYCFSEDSKLLRVGMEPGDAYYEATLVGEVEDADFELPYPIVDPD